jgi:hypothetical protein
MRILLMTVSIISPSTVANWVTDVREDVATELLVQRHYPHQENVHRVGRRYITRSRCVFGRVCLLNPPMRTVAQLSTHIGISPLVLAIRTSKLVQKHVTLILEILLQYKKEIMLDQ